MNSNEVSQNTAAVPSSSSLSMSSSKDFHSSTLAISSSPFEVLSAGMANKQTITALTLVSSVLATSSVLVSTSVVPSSALSRSYSSSVATMSSNLITEQGTSALPSVSSLTVLSSAISLRSLPRGHLSSVVMNTTLAIDKSTPETPSPSSMLLVSSTVVSQQSGTLFSDDLIEIQRTLSSILTLSSFILLTVCPKMVILNETSGILTSPYYPRLYPFNEKCSWKITASEGERIVLVIEDLYIRDCGSSCTCDYLEIQNGSSSDGISGRRRCRYYKDRGIVYYSAKDVLRLTFVSDSRVTYWWYRGFKAIYMKVKYNATKTGIGKLLEIGCKRKVKRFMCRRSGDQLSTKLYEILFPYNRLIVTVIFKYFTE